MFRHSKPILHTGTFIALLASLLAGALIVTPAHAAGIVVNTDTDKTGLFLFDGLCGLREAVANANGDNGSYGDCAAGSGADTITFAANYTITLTDQLSITSAITLDGNGAGNTIIQASTCNPVTLPGGCIPATYRVLEVTGAGTLTLDGLTVQHGRCPGSGASSCSAGGGIYNAGTLTVGNVTFSGNSAYDYGGGMFNYSGSPTLSNVTFSGNSAYGSGGGMSNYSGSPTLSNVTFSGNSAYFGGGGMSNYSGSPTLSNVTFSGNYATSTGGGMGTFSGSPTLTNVTFSGNSAYYGGGMYNYGFSSPTLTNVTFRGNSANSSGGGMYNISNPTLTNTLIANSTGGGDCTGFLNPASSNNLIEDSLNACGLSNGVNGNIIGQDPNLGPLADNGGFTPTHALLAGSPAIDAGTNTGCPATDQRGMTRPQGSLCDIGAFEYEVETATATFKSVGTYDGWVLESTETSGMGGSLNFTATTIRVGDDAGDKQYRSIVSFNTASLPDTAVITKVTLKVKKQAVVGTNPFTTHGPLKAAIRKPYFGSAVTLANGDFQAAASLSSGTTFGSTPVSGWYSAVSTSAVYPYISKTGTTQFRLRFTLDDNDDLGADYLRFYSGNAGAAYRPQLIVEYYVP